MDKNAALDYKIYQVLLESDLTDEEKQALVEVGFLQKLKSVFSGVGAIPKSIADTFKSGMYNVQLVAAKNNIEKEVDELRKIAGKLGKGEEFVNQFLNALMKSAGVSPAAVAQAPAKAEETSSEAAPAAEVKPGTKVDAAKPAEAVPALAQAAAQVAGQDPEAAVAQAEEKKVDLPKVTQVLAKAIAQKTKSNVASVAKVIDYLIKNNHMVTEGSDFSGAVEQLNASAENDIVLERWNKMAGLLTEAEEKVDPADYNKFKNIIAKVRNDIPEEEVSDEDLIQVLATLDDLDSIQIK